MGIIILYEPLMAGQLLGLIMIIVMITAAVHKGRTVGNCQVSYMIHLPSLIKRWAIAAVVNI